MPIFRRENGKLEAVPGNYAILTQTGVLDAETVSIPREHYSNHFGIAGSSDSFLEIFTTGAGISGDAAHKVELSTGLGGVGLAVMQSEKTFVLDAQPIFANFLVGDVQAGDKILNFTMVGFRNDFSDLASVTNSVLIYRVGYGQWYAQVANATLGTQLEIAAIVSGDVISIMVTNTKATFFVNGAIVATITTHIPTATLHCGAAVGSSQACVASAETISVDQIEIIKYY